jgi:quercetin dioxygenase-like cupin family protein
MTMPEADSPAAGFRPFFNPATGEWITYTAIAADNDGQLVRFSWRSVPGGVITEHIHPRQEERFTILAGEAHFTLGGEQRTARAGETIVVPAGVPHSEGNPGPGEIEGIVELRPALHAKEFHQALPPPRYQAALRAHGVHLQLIDVGPVDHNTSLILGLPQTAVMVPAPELKAAGVVWLALATTVCQLTLTFVVANVSRVGLQLPRERSSWARRWRSSR